MTNILAQAQDCLKNKNIHKAIILLENFLEKNKTKLDVYLQLNACYKRTHDYKKGIDLLLEAHQFFPKKSNILNSLASHYYRLNDKEKAKQYFEKSIELDENNEQALNNLGVIALDNNHNNLAVDYFKKSFALDNSRIEQYDNLAKALTKTGEWQAAKQLFETALQKEENASLHCDYGYLLNKLGEIKKSLAHYDKALQFDKNYTLAEVNRFSALCLLEKFEPAWQAYQSRWQLPDNTSCFVKLNIDYWKGEALNNKTLLILPEQGIGDEIMFASLYPALEKTCTTIIVVCEPRLLSLFQHSFPQIKVTCDYKTLDQSVINFYCYIGDLPEIICPNITQIENKTAYLKSDSTITKQLRQRYLQNSEKYLIGISWRSGNKTNHMQRSIALEEWKDLLSMPNIQWVNLQYGDCSKEINYVEKKYGIHIIQDSTIDPLKDITLFSAQINAMDLIISIDNSTVHLAGALGKTVWTLLPYVPDWRWLLDKETTTWYPTMKLFRQTKAQDWHETLKILNKNLQLNTKIHYLFHQAIAYKNQGDTNAAKRIHKQILEKKPDYIASINSLAMIYHNNQQYDKAIHYYKQSIALAPNVASIYSNLGVSYYMKHDMKTAKKHLNKAIEIDTNYYDAYNNLGCILMDEENYSASLLYFKHVILLNNTSEDAYNNAGKAYRLLGHWETALAYYDKSITIKNNARAHCSAGFLLTQRGDINTALHHYEQALKIKPEHSQSHFNRAHTLLVKGDFSQGWEEYEWRWKLERTKNYSENFNKPLWKKEKNIVLLVCTEQGFGDSIHFIRYIKLIKPFVKKIILQCELELINLFTSMPEVEEIFDKQSKLPDFDYYCPLLSLPYILGTTLESIPKKTPYLCAHPSLKEKWKKLLPNNKKLNIGISWTGRTQHAGVSFKKPCQLQDFSPILTLQNVNFINLQLDDDYKKIQQHPLSSTIVKLQAPIINFADTAAIIEQLDLVISIDTATAHLAGALNTPIWALISYAPDWRWLLEREDSPWYPCMRLFRQKTPDNWLATLSQLKQALQSLISETIISELDHTVLFGKGIECHKNNNYQLAVLYYLKAEQQSSCDFSLYLHLANAYLSIEDFYSAIDYFKKALAINPGDINTQRQLAQCYQQIDATDLAIDCLHYITKLLPENSDTFTELGMAYQKNYQRKLAESAFQQACALNADDYRTHNNLANILNEQGKYAAAITHFDTSIRLNPEQASTYSNLGNSYLGLNNINKAIECFQLAIKKQPQHINAHNNLSLALLKAERFDEGWKEYCWRAKLPNNESLSRQFSSPAWHNENLHGKTILLLKEQGIGDEIMFARFIPELQATAENIILECDSRLKPLYQRSFPGIHCIETIQHVSAGIDYHCFLGDLPAISGGNLNQLATSTSYLKADPAMKHYLRKQYLSSKKSLLVGFAWKTRNNFTSDIRTAALQYWQSLFQQTSVTWVNLQYGDESDSIANAETAYSCSIIQDSLIDPLIDLDDFSAQIAAMDLIISIDNSTVHLAGALGKPVWILLPFCADWRWLQHPEKTVWYDSATLFRQEQAGDWTTLFEQVAIELQKLIK